MLDSGSNISNQSSRTKLDTRYNTEGCADIIDYKCEIHRNMGRQNNTVRKQVMFELHKNNVVIPIVLL